jgi:hypothetical protein
VGAGHKAQGYMADLPSGNPTAVLVVIFVDRMWKKIRVKGKTWQTHLLAQQRHPDLASNRGSYHIASS